ncbi:transglutaminase domain-containing protein [archaeon]|nr:transglutaminase domain-containing protein [archaeon]MBT6823827.1 transglutaminase domain-containing protein [archaeon]MBT7107138.1 transglutaminase domain-containing protein [archaeon]MBT7297248.1 transglutaminase domain-containing protein [archaeon]
MDLEVLAQLTMEEDESGASLDYAEATLLINPLQIQHQSILDLNTFSDESADISEVDDSLKFRWEDYSETIEFGYTARIETENILHKIPRIQFPIIDLDEEYEIYLEGGEKTDITPEILEKANEIIEGESNLYSAVFKLANWVNENIEYDLNSQTANAALSSSWVLENKEGVCDELATLFISLSRSVGIPARFISGVAYSSSTEDFGNHGWAEAYFPDYGWVPFDISFGQFGWIDPTHIRLLENVDSGTPSIRYNWRSNNVLISPNGLNISAEITGFGNKINSPFDIDLEILENNVAPGSYVPIKVTIENPYDSYVSDTAIITKAPELLSDNTKITLLKPNQNKVIFWIIKIPDNAEDNMRYSTQIEVVDLFGEITSEVIEFSSSEGYDYISEDKAREMIEELEEIEEKTYSEEISLECGAERSYYYTFENIPISCKIKNIGNKILTGISVCLDQECEIVDLTISEEKKILFEIQAENLTERVVSAKNEVIDLISNIQLTILGKPDLKMIDFEYPDQVDYGENFNFIFRLDSKALIKNLSISINGANKQIIQESQGITNLEAKLNSKYLLNNKINILIEYEDEFRNTFELNEVKTIKVMNLPWYAQIYKFFIDLVN